MFYLQNVCLDIKKEDVKSDPAKWAFFCDALAQNGITLTDIAQDAGGHSTMGGWIVKPTNERIGDWPHVAEPANGRAGILWITDEPAAARAHLRNGEAVMGYLSKVMTGADTGYVSLYGAEEDSGSGSDSFAGVTYLGMDLTAMEPQYLEKVYRRQKGIPCEIAHTERCLIRESVPADADAFYEIYRDESARRYLDDLPKEKEAFDDWLKAYAEKAYAFWDMGIWTIVLKETGEVVGRAGLSLREGFEEPELGFVIAEKWRKKGLAAENCRAILKYARENYEFAGIRALVSEENEASRYLLKELGFVPVNEVNAGAPSSDKIPGGRRILSLRISL